MKKIFKIVVIFILIIGCTGKSKSDMNTIEVKGSIEGLRKGTLYLQKIQDSILIDLDSLVLKGSSDFRLKAKINSPEIFYLYLDKKDGDTLNDRIRFFGEKGTIEINTLLKTYESSAQISGSENHSLLEEYLTFIRRFDQENLKLVKVYFNELRENNASKKLDSIQKKMDNLLLRRYLFTINFASNNSDKEIAPYLMVTEVNDTSIKLLDSVMVKLSPEVKNSKYGKDLKLLIDKRKKEISSQ
mgnify:FL=1|tara:strand:- start:79 stop:807 length:729 start_codon:yes stop_codon:yes gene_type:complete